MTITPEKAKTAYQALCDLGLSLAATSHNWRNEQRKAWERAERALRPLVTFEFTGLARLYAQGPVE